MTALAKGYAMVKRLRRSAIWSLVWLATAVSSSAWASQSERQDLVFVIDVSRSMVVPWQASDGSGTHPASDPGGIRWDGLQFALDVTRPGDRVALVLFRVQAEVLKQIEPSGLVSVDKSYPEFGGRTGLELLKAVVEELQQAEAAGQRDTFVLPSLQTESSRARGELPPVVRLAHGTSVITALRQARRLELRPAGEGVRRRVFLFTDGQETRPDPAIIDFKADPPALRGSVGALVKGFRDAGVSLFVFGLGGDIDRVLLRALAEQARPAPVTNAGAPADPESQLMPFYNPMTNVQLVADLRQVFWELGGYWTRDLDGKQVGGGVQFKSPILGLGQDQGLLLYRLVDEAVPLGDGTAVSIRVARNLAHDPALRVIQSDRGTVVQERLDDFRPLRSRSHLYYDLTGGAQRRGVPIGGQLAIDLPGAETSPADYTGVLAARPNIDLFRYETPRGVDRFTPKDGIPFRVIFLPDRRTTERVDYKPSQFRVEITLTRANARPGEAASIRRLTLVAPPDLPPGTEPGPQEFTGELVLDPDPQSPGRKELVGTHFVDVTIRALAGPLVGTERRLIRRSVKVGNYPALRSQPDQIVLSNRDAASLGQETALSLDQDTHPPQPLARLHARLASSPRSSEGAAIDDHAFRVRAEPDIMPGTGARLGVVLPAEAWSAFRAGRYDGGKVEVQTPWGQPTSVKLTVEKDRYRVQVTERIQVPLPSTGQAHRELAVTARLETLLPVREQVQIVDPVDPSPGAEVERPFQPERGGEPLTLRVEGLGRTHELAGGSSASPARLSLVLHAAGPVKTGLFSREFRLVGPSIDPASVIVQVLVDQPQLWLVRPGRDDLACEELAVPGLAGTRVRRRFELRSVLPDQEFEPLGGAKLTLLRRDGLDRVEAVLRALDTKQSRSPAMDLEMAIPPCVLEGRFESELKLPVRSALSAFQVSMLIHIDVTHRGVRPDVDPPLRLRPFPDPCVPRATSDLRLISTAGQGTLRWSARHHPNPKPAPECIPLDPARLDVQFRGQSVLVPGAPADPVIAPNRPCPLTVVCRTDGLAPGLYSHTVQFLGHDNDDPGAPVGAPFDFDVIVLVPGRVVERVEPDSAANAVAKVGKSSRYFVVVSSYGTEPGLGQWVELDGAGHPVGPSSSPGSPQSVRDDSAAGVRRDRFPIAFTPRRAGTITYRVDWPRLCSSTSRAKAATETPSMVESITFNVEARGRLEVASLDPTPSLPTPDLGEKPLVYTNEKILIRGIAPPGAESLRFHGRLFGSGTEPGKGTEITLFDDGNTSEHGDEVRGDGSFSARFNGFAQTGRYEIALASDSAKGVSLDPLTLEVGFELQAPRREQPSLIYGGGNLLGGWWPNHEHLKLDEAIVLSNQHGTPCQWTVRVLYPGSESDNRKVVEGVITQIDLTDSLDSSQHLQAGLFVASNSGNPSATQSRLTGRLEHGQRAVLGLDIVLPEQVRDYLYLGRGAIPEQLRRPNGLVLAINLQWDDGSSREFLLPVAVSTYSVKWLAWVCYPVLAVLLIGLVVALYWWRARTRGMPEPVRHRATGVVEPTAAEGATSGGTSLVRRVRRWLIPARGEGDEVSHREREQDSSESTSRKSSDEFRQRIHRDEE